MAWKKRRKKWNWRNFLTSSELRIIETMERQAEQIEKMQADWDERWGRKRQLIVNRAIKRAEYAARSST